MPCAILRRSRTGAASESLTIARQTSDRAATSKPGVLGAQCRSVIWMSRIKSVTCLPHVSSMGSCRSRASRRVVGGPGAIARAEPDSARRSHCTRHRQQRARARGPPSAVGSTYRASSSSIWRASICAVTSMPRPPSGCSTFERAFCTTYTCRISSSILIRAIVHTRPANAAASPGGGSPVVESQVGWLAENVFDFSTSCSSTVLRTSWTLAGGRRRPTNRSMSGRSSAKAAAHHGSVRAVTSSPSGRTFAASWRKDRVGMRRAHAAYYASPRARRASGIDPMPPARRDEDSLRRVAAEDQARPTAALSSKSFACRIPCASGVVPFLSMARPRMSDPSRPRRRFDER